MVSYHQQWVSASSSGRSHATSLVNSSLSQRYMPSMELGVLCDMPNIRNKACLKLFKQQEHHRSKLLSSCKDMVAVVNCMANISRSIRCFLKGPSSSSLAQFSSYSEDVNDTGDSGGIPIFAFLSISAFDELYPGEFDDLSTCNLYSKETCEPVTPRLRDCKSSMPTRAVQHA